MSSPRGSPPSSSPKRSTPALADVLEQLGLSEYLDTLVENGFRDWNTVVDITEDDFTALNFKLGHRRSLQREIATFRGIPHSESLEADVISVDDSSLSATALEGLSVSGSAPAPREKRRYRRHPRPDSNAPKKPKTAYVNFADRLRTDPEVASLTFVDIAKEVGRQWQVLPAEKKRVWESHAARALQEYEMQMDEYKKTDSWRKYQTYLSEFKTQQAQAAKPKRPSNHRVDSFMRVESSRASPASSEGLASAPSSLSAGTEAELCHNALTLAFSELVSLRGEVLGQGMQPYDGQHLPAEELVRRAMHAFVRGTGSLLYMWTYSQVDDILDRVYKPAKQIDAMTLAECFTVAAMGAHYDMECFPDRIRRLLYASGTLHFHEATARVDLLRTMRLLLSMSFYALLEKHLSARYLVAAGLQIARWRCPNPQQVGDDDDAENWRRIYRSLIFMDCWLSYTLGYSSEVSAHDIAIACTSNEISIPSTNEIIHEQTSKIGLVAAEIAKTLASPELVTRENVDMLARKLETWRVEVPPPLQITSLTSDNPPDLTLYQRRAILMVHIMYLGALLLLYRQLLVAAAENQLTDGAAWALDLSISDTKLYRNECAIAAQQMARILRLISFDGTLTKRCWLLIYWSFTACIFLLFSATTKMLDGQSDGVETDLVYAKSCMDTLEPCREYEPIAAQYCAILWPIYDKLRDVYQRLVGKTKTSIFMLIQAEPNTVSPQVLVSKQEMGPVSEKLSVLLTDPFGRKQGGLSAGGLDGGGRRVLNADGSCSVFWWK